MAIYTPGTVLRQIRCLYLLKSAFIYKYSACAVSYDIIDFQQMRSKLLIRRERNTCYKCVTPCIERNEMKKIWLSVLLSYTLVAIRGAFATLFIPAVSSNYWVPERNWVVLFSYDTPVFLNTFLVQGNTVTLLLLVLLAYFDVIIIIDIEIG